MKLYRCLVCSNNISSFEDIYIGKNRKQILQKIKKDNRKLLKILETRVQFKIKEKELKNFFQKIGRLLNAGISLKKAIEFQKQSYKKLNIRFKINNIYIKLQKGEDIYDILKTEEMLKEREQLILYVAENAGKLGDGFLQIAYLKEQKEKLNNELKIALAYPLFILCISTIILLLIFCFIVPNFEQIYSLNKDKLPIITKIILSVKNFIFQYQYIIIFFIVIFVLSFRFEFTKNKIFKIGIIKKFILEKNIINIFENLSMLLKDGISIDKAIEIILENIDNRGLKNKIIILKNIKKGETLSSCFNRLNLLTFEEINLIAIGEETGTIEIILKEMALLRTEKLNKKMQLVLKLVEPTLLLIIGIVISFFVIGLYLPILNMSDVLEI